MLLEICVFTGVKIVTPKELRGHDSECQRLNHQLLDLSHIGEGVPKMHQSYTGWPKVFSESSCCAGLAAGAALAGAVKPARRRAIRERRATIFTVGTPVLGRCFE